MQIMINVLRISDTEFDVTLTDGRGESWHRVTAAADSLRRLAAGHSAEVLIEAAFRFLLDRELKESILRQFDLTVVAHYFPEFETELSRYLDDTGR